MARLGPSNHSEAICAQDAEVWSLKLDAGGGAWSQHGGNTVVLFPRLGEGNRTKRGDNMLVKVAGEEPKS